MIIKAKDIPAAPVFIRTQHNYDHNAASNESGLACQEPTRAQQHHKEECDINVIVKRFGITGKMPINQSEARYGDFTDAEDYHTALNKIIAAEDDFMALPADIRTQFDNNPANLIGFLNNPQNKTEAEKLGLIKPTSSYSEPVNTQETVTDTP
jgi:phage internal scaffolding protein